MILSPVLSGVGDGVLLFLVASGLTLIFGVMGILNFSHGGYFMFGAYFGYAVVQHYGAGLPLFFAALVIGAGAGGLVGVLTEFFVFRRLYQLPEVSSLLGTFGLLLIMEGIAEVVWGVSPLSMPFPKGLSGQVRIAGMGVASYNLLLVAFGGAVLLALWFVLSRTAFGRRARAVSEDRYVCELLGIATARVSTGVFALGTALAGLGGALAAPILALTPGVATSFIIQAFAVVVVGGLGSVGGSMIAALVFGLADSFAVTYYPPLGGMTLYILMFVVLLVRPQGVMGSHRMGDSSV